MRTYLRASRRTKKPGYAVFGYRQCPKSVDDIGCLARLTYAIICRRVGLISLIGLHQIFVKKGVNLRRMFRMKGCQCVFKLTDPTAELCDTSMEMLRGSQNKSDSTV